MYKRRLLMIAFTVAVAFVFVLAASMAIPATSTNAQGPNPTPLPTQAAYPGMINISPEGMVPYNEQGTTITTTGKINAGGTGYVNTVNQKDEGFVELVYATNGDQCNDPTVYLYKLLKDPSVSAQFQWDECTRMNGKGTGRVQLVIKNVSSGSLYFTLTGNSVQYVVDSGSTETLKGSVGVEVPTGVSKTFTVVLNSGTFAIERSPVALKTSGTWTKKDLNDGSGRFYVLNSSLGSVSCAWSALWNMKVITGDVAVDFKDCIVPVFTGTGDIEVNVWGWQPPGENGYDVANQSGLGMVLVPVGAGKMDVKKLDGTWDYGVELTTASGLISVPLEKGQVFGPQRTIIFHLANQQVVMQYGDNTRDLTKPGNPVFVPKW